MNNNAKNKIGIYMIGLIIVVGAIYLFQTSQNKNVEQSVENTIVKNTETIPPVQTPPTPPTLPTTCVTSSGGTPVITGISAYSATVGTLIEISGCNFSGFEGDKTAWIKNSSGTKGLMYGESGSTDSLIKITITTPLCQEDNSFSGEPCSASFLVTPGAYDIYTAPWGNQSNEVAFTVL